MRPEGLLLLGPTGVGKTPLGDLLEREGLGGRTCHHLDFGARLRAVASGALRPAGLTDDDVALVAASVRAGTLLEDDAFPVAAAIVDDFLAGSSPASTDRVVLNGLPRHVGQADGLRSRLDVRAVVHLDADAETLRARICLDAGGDRGRREDDGAQAVEGRLARFEARTRPLLAYYAERGARVRRLRVGLDTAAADLRRALENA